MKELKQLTKSESNQNYWSFEESHLMVIIPGSTNNIYATQTTITKSIMTTIECFSLVRAIKDNWLKHIKNLCKLT